MLINVNMNLLIKSFNFCLLIITINAQNGKCPPTNMFKGVFETALRIEFEDKTEAEQKEMDHNEIGKRIFKGGMSALETLNMVDSAGVFDENRCLDAVDVIFNTDPETKESIRLGYKACFHCYKKTPEEQWDMCRCLVQVKDILCGIPIKEVSKPEYDLPASKQKPDFPAPTTSQCRLPSDYHDNAFRCVMSQESKDSIDPNAVHSFFNAIETDEKSKTKLQQDTETCLAQPSVDHKAQIQCLMNTYRETCTSWPEPIKFGSGPTDSGREQIRKQKKPKTNHKGKNGNDENKNGIWRNENGKGNIKEKGSGKSSRRKGNGQDDNIENKRHQPSKLQFGFSDMKQAKNEKNGKRKSGILRKGFNAVKRKLQSN